jgi:phage anti-repressor protein
MADSLALVPVFTGTLNSQSVQLCDARTLHAFMQVKRDFNTWIKGRIRKFGFVEGVDFITVKNLSSPDLGSTKLDSPNRGNQVHGGDRKSIDYHLTLDMAKELSMVENNEQGREARRYFIACERRVLDALVAYGYPAPDASITPAKTAPDSIDVRALLLSGQSEPVPLTPAQQALIDASAWAMAREAYELSREHLARRVAYHTPCIRTDGASLADVKRVVDGMTLGKALAHKYHDEVQLSLSLLRHASEFAAGSVAAMERVLAAAAQGQGCAVNPLVRDS